jgi:hypothetical protein
MDYFLEIFKAGGSYCVDDWRVRKLGKIPSEIIWFALKICWDGKGLIVWRLVILLLLLGLIALLRVIGCGEMVMFLLFTILLLI